MWQQWVNFGLAIWLIIQPNVGMSYSGVQAWNIITGILIIIFSLWGIWEHRQKAR